MPNVLLSIHYLSVKMAEKINIHYIMHVVITRVIKNKFYQVCPYLNPSATYYAPLIT